MLELEVFNIQEVPGKMTRPYDPKREKRLDFRQGSSRTGYFRKSRRRGYYKAVAARRFRHAMFLDEERMPFTPPRQKIGASWELDD